MLVYKQWEKRSPLGRRLFTCEGWFLFGILPLYIRRIGVN